MANRRSRNTQHATRFTFHVSRFTGLAILALYLALAVFYGVIAPPFESPDEVGHFFAVKYVADHRQLPIPDRELAECYLYGQEGTQPPLYYLGGAWLLRLAGLDTEDAWGYLHVNPHTTCGSPHLAGNKGFLAHDPAREAFPWRDSVLALHLLRLYSTALGLATVAGVYATARLCFPDRMLVAPLAGALTALNPQFLFVSAGVNNDNLLVALCVWSLYLVLRAIRRGLAPVASLLTGTLIGLASLTKLGGLLLLPLACAGLLLAAWLQDRGTDKPTIHHLRLAICHLSLVALPALAVGGWWYARNALVYADPTLIEHHLAIVSRRDPTPLPLILREVPSIFYSYWGRFSCDLSPGGWYYAFWGLVTLAGLAGLIAGWRGLALWQRIGSLLLAGWFALVFVGWFRWNLIASGVQGRLMFPATVSVSVLVGGGLAGCWPRRRGTGGAGMKRGVGSDAPGTGAESRGVGTGAESRGVGTGAESGGAGERGGRGAGERGGAGTGAESTGRAWVGAGALVLGLTWVGLALWVPVGLIHRAYAPPPRYRDANEVEVPHRVHGTFGARITLLGYEVQPLSLEAGQALEVTLYLSASRLMTDTYSMGLWLVSAIPGDTTRLAGLDTWPGNGNYPTLAWQPGEVIVDTYRLAIPEDVPRTQAWLVQLNVYRLGEDWLPLAQGGQRVGDRAILGLVRVGASEPPQVPPLAQLEPFIFGDAIALWGAEIVPEEENLRVRLWWESRTPLEGDYTVFVHLVDEAGRLASTGDGPPLAGGFPTRLWRPGDGVADEHVIPLPPDLPPGVYTIQVGWYDPLSGARLPAVRGEERLPQDAAVAGTWPQP